ncbi:MAG: hypothetical protein WAZ12_01955 [Candidatus Absconditicoccaceae bacterium]
MFKKNLLKLFFVSIFLLGFVSSISKADVQNIKMTYCENVGINTQDDSKLITINPGEEQEICLNFSSTEEGEVNVIYGFTEGSLNNKGTQVCNPSIEEANPFSNLFSNDNGNIRSFNLKSGDIKIIKEKISVPVGMSGMIYGCMLHKIKGLQSKKMFTIEALMKRHLNIFIGGAAEIKKSVTLLGNKGDIFSSNSNISVKKIDNDKISLGLLIKNNGNISQNINIDGSINNALGYEKTFTTTPVLVGPGKEIQISSEALLIPTYKGFFNTSIKITAQPVFAFNVDNLDPALKETTTITETGKIFIFSRIWIIAGILALAVLMLIFRPLFKKHQQ